MLATASDIAAKSSRRRVDDSAVYAVEQLEPKILLSAAPIDAPADAFGFSPLAAVDSSALEEVRFGDVIEAEMTSEFFEDASEKEDDQEVFGAGEDFDWGDEAGENEEIVITEDQRLTGSGELDQDLIIDGVFAPGNSPGLVEVADFENNGACLKSSLPEPSKLSSTA